MQAVDPATWNWLAEKGDTGPDQSSQTEEAEDSSAPDISPDLFTSLGITREVFEDAIKSNLETTDAEGGWKQYRSGRVSLGPITQMRDSRDIYSSTSNSKFSRAVAINKNPSFQRALNFSVRPPEAPSDGGSSRPCWARKPTEITYLDDSLIFVDAKFSFAVDKWTLELTYTNADRSDSVMLPMVFRLSSVARCYRLAAPRQQPKQVPASNRSASTLVPPVETDQETDVQREALEVLRSHFCDLVREQARANVNMSLPRLGSTYTLAFARMLRSPVGSSVRTVAPERFKVTRLQGKTSAAAGAIGVKVYAFDTSHKQCLSLPCVPLELPAVVRSQWLQLDLEPNTGAAQLSAVEAHALSCLEYMVAEICKNRDNREQPDAATPDMWKLNSPLADYVMHSKARALEELLAADNRFALACLNTNRFNDSQFGENVGFYPARGKLAGSKLYLALSRSFVRQDLGTTLDWWFRWVPIPEDLPWYWVKWACERGTAALLAGGLPSAVLRDVVDLIACLDASITYTSDADLCPDEAEMEVVEDMLGNEEIEEPGQDSLEGVSAMSLLHARKAVNEDRRRQTCVNEVQINDTSYLVKLARSLNEAVLSTTKVEDFAGRAIEINAKNPHLKPSVDKADLADYSSRSGLRLHSPDNVNWMAWWMNRMKWIWSIFVLVGTLHLMSLVASSQKSISRQLQLLQNAIQNASAIERDTVPFRVAQRIRVAKHIISPAFVASRSTYALLDRLVAFNLETRSRPFKAGGLICDPPSIGLPQRVQTIRVYSKKTLAAQKSEAWLRVGWRIVEYVGQIEARFGSRIPGPRFSDFPVPNTMDDASVRTLWDILKIYGVRQVRAAVLRLL